MKKLSSSNTPATAILVSAIVVFCVAIYVYAFSRKSEENSESTSAQSTPTPTLSAGKQPSVFSIKDEVGNSLLNGADIANATAKTGVNSLGQSGTPQIIITFTPSGAVKLAQVTKNNVGKQLPIYVEDQRISDPLIPSEITGGEIVVTGDFTLQEAQELVTKINK